jgi:hypothetical protein
MNWEDVKSVFVGPSGPVLMLVAVVFLAQLGGSDRARSRTATLFSFVALKVFQRFEFSLYDQYLLTLLLYIGIWEILPRTDRT